ncbi:wax ester/triacylglycerol synthase domain-containing protein [Pseudonocardia yuanmonensis]|uniref:wax ester/triacylglycerol synthase domain-containing protein n=1 Tax=Pseudonocardia yuanmonensis TaxID=1095914 RepID=UPI0031E588DA
MVTRLRLDELMSAWVGGRDSPMQIGLLCVFDAEPFRRADGLVDLAGVRAALALRASRVPGLHRRVVWTRPGEGRPFWAEDPAFAPPDLVEVTTLPPGTDLPSWAASRAATPLPPDRPLWRADVVGGLPGDRVAVLLVVSHVLADGAGGIALLGSLLDQDPAAAAPVVPPAPAAPLPSHRQLLRERLHEIADAARRRGRRGRRDRRGAGGPRAGVHGLTEIRAALAEFAGPEPVTSLPRQVGPGRRLGVVHVPLPELLRTGHALGVTVNDLVLAAVAAGLREYLTARDEGVPGPVLRASVPATTGHADRQVGRMLVVGLPVGEPDTARRLAVIHHATTQGKARLRAADADVTDLRLPVPVARPLLCWARRFGSRRLTLSVTDVTGPSAPLWLAGARLRAAAPIAPLSAGVPLTVAALSYAGEVVLTINASDSLTDLDLLTEATARGVAALRELAGVAAERPPAHAW